MNQEDFLNAIIHLQKQSGKQFPHNFIPGAMGHELYAKEIDKAKEIRNQNKFNVGESEAIWNAYQFNPPQYLQEGVVWLWKDWATHEYGGDKEPEWRTEAPLPQTPQGPSNWLFQFAYQVGTKDNPPTIPSTPIQPWVVPNGHRPDAHVVETPDGWTDKWPGKPCWMIERTVFLIDKETAITGVDPDAMPKPTWAELEAALVLVNQINKFHDLNESTDHHGSADTTKRKLTDKSVIEALGKTHVGDGLDHMTGLLQMVEQSNIGGATMPVIELRDDKHKPKKIYEQSKVRALLDEVAKRENIVESAHNRIIGPIIEKHDAAFDETKTWPERLKLMEEYAAMVENYDTTLKAEMAKVDTSALPTDLPTLKAVYTERLESIAMGRIKFFKGVLTQQGVDLDPACDDEADAIRKVVQASRLGQHEIEASTGDLAAQTHYENAVKEIGAVWPLNTPNAFFNGTRLDVDISLKKETPVELVFRHPDGAGIPGNVSVAARANPYVVGSFISVSQVFDGSAFKETKLELSPPDAAGETATYEVQARNLCGPAIPFTVSVTRPAMQNP